MAIWQFRLDLLPQKLVQDRDATVPTALPPAYAEETVWWSGVQPPIGFERALGEILPEIDSWSTSMRIWGDERSNSAVVCYRGDDKAHVEWVGFRIDVRVISRPLLAGICLIARKCGCVLVTSKREILEPEEGPILAAIDESVAKLFLTNPVAALRAAAKISDHGGSGEAPQ